MPRFSSVALVLAFGAVVPQASGIVVAATDQATILFPQSQVPPGFTAGPVTVLAWIDPAEAALTGGVFQVPGIVELAAVNGAVRARALAGGVLEVTAETPIALVEDEWALIGLTYDPALGRLTAFARSASSASSAVATSDEPGMAGLGLGPIIGDYGVGSNPLGMPALVGAYGTTVLRDHTISQADFDAVWASKSFWAPYDLVNTSSGGAMNGPAGCAWMTNHSVTTEPVDFSGGPGPFDRAAILGQPVTAYNVHVYDRTFVWPLEYDLTRIVRTTSAASGFTYATHREGAYAGFFQVKIPNAGIPPQFVGAASPKARRLATGPDEFLRVVVSGNSRAVRNSDGTGLAPGTFASGFEDRNRSQVCGVLNRSAVLGSGGNPWFGFDTALQNPLFSEFPAVVEIGSESEPYGDFGRFWSGQGNPASRGPGPGVLIPSDGGFYGLRCRPEPGSLLVATEPLVVEAYVLRFPGASDLEWRPDQGVSQHAAAAKFHPVTGVTLDTTNRVHVVTPDDGLTGPAVLFLRGEDMKQVAPGEVCHVESGAGAGSIALVESVEEFGDGAWIEFVHPLGEMVGVGSVLRFGAWGIETITHTWPGLAPDDPEDWRGLRLDAGATGTGVVVFAFSAWRPGVAGFAFGVAGWSGHGYEEQIVESSPEVLGAWMAALDADVWIQSFAQQRTTPPIMSTYLAHVRAALPGAEVVWVGEMAHHLSTLSTWHKYILQNAQAEGVVALSVLEDPTLGTVWEQYADNLRTDIGHLTLRGNRRLADLWTAMLLDAAGDPCATADFEQDGDYDIFDFLAFQNGIVTQDPRADVEGDGDWDVFDFLAFQGVFAGCA